MKTSNPTFIANFSSMKSGYNMMYAAMEGTFPLGQKVFFGRPDSHFSETFVVLNGLLAEACYVIEDEIKQMVKDAINEILNNPSKIEKIHREAYAFNTEFFRYADECLNTDLSKVSNSDLAEMYRRIIDIQVKSHAHAIITTWFVDSNGEDLSKFLIDRIKKIIAKSGKNIDYADAFSLLTTLPANSVELKSEIENLKLLKKIGANDSAKNVIISLQDISKLPENIPEEIKKAIIQHFQKWRWRNFDYLGPAYDLDYYLQIWQGMLRQNFDYDSKIKEIESRPAKVKEQRNKLMLDMNISKSNRQLFNIAANIVFLKGYRKDAIFHGSYATAFLLEEISRRLFITLNQAYHSTHHELIDALNGKDIDIHAINARQKKTVMHCTKGKVNILTGVDADSFLKDKKIKEEKVDLQISEMTGTIACSGFARGKIKVINSVDELSKMQEGDIMVSHATFPSLVPAMRKAGAIITEEGGITCHSAIVSRELKKPCITGLKQLLKIVKDGDEVEVDAGKGIVKFLNKSQQQWTLLWEDRPYGICMMNVINDACTDVFPKYYGVKVSTLACEYSATKARCLMLQKEVIEGSRIIFDKITHSDFLEKNFNEIKSLCIDSDKQTLNLTKADFKAMSNDDLVTMFQDAMRIFKHFYGVAFMPIFLEYGEKLLSVASEKIIRAKLAEAGKDEEFADYFVTAITPNSRTILMDEELALLNVLKRIKARKIEEVMSDPKIKAHIQKWSWITFDFFDTIAWDDDAYKSRIVDLIAEDKIDENIRKIESYVSKVSAKQDKICKELKFNDEELKILEATKKYGELKEYRKNYLLLVLYRIYILMKEIASRLNTDVKYLHFMLAKEFDTIFESYDENVPKERMKASILVSENGVSRVLLGQEYLQYLEKLPKTEVLENIQELKGMPAFVGKAKGTVKIINSAKDAGKMQKGDILVSIATFPDLVPAMKKAAAIVTDEGGITCHAAIVSRELGIPCVIGTKFATKALKDGDIVEVDAHKGTITKTAESTTNAADWFLMEEIPASSVFLLSGTFRRMTEEYRKDFNLPVHMDMLYKQNALYLYFQRKEFLANAKFLLDKTLASPKFLWDINVKNKKNQKNMFKFCDKLNKIDVTTLDDSSLLRLYSEFSLLFEKAIVSGWIDNVLEFENELFSNYLREYLNKKAALAGKTGAELFSIFTTPDKITNGIKQEIALQKIALAIKKSNKADFFISNSAEDIDVKLKKIDPKIDAMITSHAANFCWYFFMYEGPGWGRLEFIMALKEILKEGKELVIQTHKKEKQILIKKLGIDKKHQLLLKIASEIVFNKDLRKHSIYYSCYSSVSMFKEIARRLNISITESKTILPWEMEDVFANPSKFNLKTREDGFLMQFYDGNTTIYTGKTAIDFYDSVHKKNAVSLDVDAIKGSCAYPGTVQGTVRLVNSPSEISKIKEGDILVAHQTNPDILPAMKLADAFVTDLGGITCHAAIVSREMKKPCIVGTKVATKVLKDGMLVNVDADKGIVTIIDKPKNVQNDVKPDPGKKYSLANHAVDMNWANIETIWHGLLDPRIEKQVKAKFLDTFCEIIDGRTLNFYVESNELNDFVKSSAQSLISDKKLIAYLKKQTIITSEKIRDYAYHLISRINSMSDSQLSKALQEIKNLQTECVVYGTAVVFADFDGKISEASLNVLSNKKNVRCSVQDYYKALSSPEEKSLTEKAYAKIAKSKSSLKDLAKKFFWLDQGYIGRGITIDQIETIRKNAKLNQSEKNISGLSFCSITAIEKELSLSEEEKWLFKLARDIVVIKSLRADSRQFLNVVTNKIIDLIAKKLKIDSSLLECLYIEEIIEILNGKKQDMEMLQKRCKHFVFASGKDRKYSLILGDDELASFIELNVPEEKHEASSTISGKSAYSGIVRGKAKLVLSSVDISKVQNGDILVSAATSPQLISAMQKAAAFVTDVGGITSHAAIVAREMKKPCIIGTKFATTMLSDNDLIEVDADKGIVKVIEKNDASKKA